MARPHALGVVEYKGKYAVKVWDQGVVFMCEYSDEKHDWQTCTFDTKEEAEAEAKRYTECWRD